MLQLQVSGMVCWRLSFGSAVLSKHHRSMSNMSLSAKQSFGFLFDIDGVFVRGRSVIPEAKEAFNYLLDRHQKWRVPVVYVTNAGSMPRGRKAEILSSKFGVKIHPDQVIMSHSPLQMLPHFHKKHVLFCGQGAVKQIAHSLGFQDVTTLDELRAHYPQLDACDFRRLRPPPCAFERYNRRIEAIVLLSEPTHWERSLQLLSDILMSNGQPYLIPQSTVGGYSINSITQHDSFHGTNPFYPHIPVLACNIDTTWMAEAPLPRLGHGAFLACLEKLYEKMTGRRLLYTALLGKPSEMTYHFAENKLQRVAHKMRSSYLPNQSNVKRIYCIGDNPHTDIYGANLYQRYLQSQRSVRLKRPPSNVKITNGTNNIINHSLTSHYPSPSSGTIQDISRRENHSLSTGENEENDDVTYLSRPWELHGGIAEECMSVLVRTGVFQVKSTSDTSKSMLSYLSNFGSLHHRDFPYVPELHTPNLIADHVAEAVRIILLRENFPLS